jgi:DNA repair protein RecO (recombination protein O)
MAWLIPTTTKLTWSKLSIRSTNRSILRVVQVVFPWLAGIRMLASHAYANGAEISIVCITKLRYTRRMQAYVLHQRPYRETSLLVDLLSKEHGVFRGVLRGARGGRKAASNPVSAFTPLWVESTARGDLHTLTRVEPQRRGHEFAGLTWLSAMYLNELLLRLFKHSESAAVLFDHYELALTRLSTEEEPLPWVLRCFEKHLLAILGYELPLTHEADTNRAISFDKNYYFVREKGFVAVTQETAAPSFRGVSLLSLGHEVLYDADVLPELKRLLRTVLATLLGDKPLQTLVLARQWVE